MSETRHNAAQPWERQPSETNAAWQAFQFYRDLGLGRTLNESWRRYRAARGLKSTNRSPAFASWSRDHNWEERARLWDHRHALDNADQRADTQRQVMMRFYAQAPALMDKAIELALGDDDTPADATMIRFLLDKLMVQQSASSTTVHAQNVQINQQMVDKLSTEEIKQLIRETSE